VKKKKLSFLAFIFGILGLMLISYFWLAAPKEAQAACGASTSSCKTCHEIQGADPVSQKGSWHSQHAFGDYCQACHLGVATETDKTKAHAGMIANPLTQPDQTCAACHPTNTAAMVAKYTGASTAASKGTTSSTSSAPSAGTAAAPSTTVAPSPAASQIPPSQNPNYDVLDFNNNGKLPWLAWTLIIADIIVLLILAGLLWKWKKGLWPWAYVHGKKKNVPFNTLPPEVQEVFKQLLEGDMHTVMAVQKILKREDGPQLLQAISAADENELKSLLSLGKTTNGKGND
jgi:hypothetical protein